MSSEAEAVPPSDGKILIVGGYGQVGRSIAERLAPLFPGRVTVAGRNLDKAMALAAAIGHGAEGRAVDIFSAASNAALDGVVLAVVCLDQLETRFAEQCLSRGIHYVDISADYDFLSQVEMLDSLARQHGATATISVGVAPGLTNLLAARAREMLEKIERVDILLEFGLGDHHGQAAVEWMFDNLDATYEVCENGQPKPVRSFGESLDMRLPGQSSARPAWRFNFSDQHVIGRTLDVPSVSTWVRFENRFSTWLFAKFSQAGLGRLLHRRRWRAIAVWLFMNVHMGSDVCGIAVQATGRDAADKEKTLTLGLIGRREAMMTAIVTVETVRQLLVGEPPVGVFHSEQIVELDPVIMALRKDLPDLYVSL
tara:strand:+ start:4479 stop:5582 length:1104 start_codon:yes stop_codon:yes gene_type:complete